MTNPGDSDEWWKQYGGEGVSPEAGSQGSVPQYPSTPQYPSAPQYPQQPAQTPPPQPQYPSYPQQPVAGPQQPYPQNPGYPNAYQPYGYPQQAQGNNGLAIGSLIASIIGLCSCGIGAIVGIILGVIALNQIKESGQGGRGMALAGIWIGAGAIVLWIVYIVLDVALTATH
ncbi:MULTISPECIES: DUF4190 domain-containing protein [unclassified Nocardia]|uniref:DUF4190 domain-containing protein n=1 Tax=unclassified Nocardia TaxID=2637762 RepID=UPI0034287E7E